MKQQIKLLLVLIVAFLFIAESVFATKPSGIPPANNVPTLINTGSTDQTKLGGVVFGFNSDPTFVTALITPRFGIGFTNPTEAVEVNGSFALTDGTQGDGRFLTALDNTGKAYWKSYGTGAGTIELPSGAVVPFNLSSCPTGWSPYSKAAGRVIVGSGLATGGTDPQTNIYATSKSFGDVGGAETHTLTYEEIVHKHNFESDDGDREKKLDDGSGVDYYDQNKPTLAKTSLAGGDAAIGGLARSHSEIQPYIALTYCKKNP